MGRPVSRLVSLAGVAFALFVVAGARAEEPAQDQTSIRGVERRAHRPGDAVRKAGNAALFLPREALELFFIGTGAAGAIIEDEQVVPRIQSLWRPQPGEISIFPTVFIETGSVFNIGGRIIAREKNFASSLRAGYGGPDDIIAETRVKLSAPRPRPISVGAEWFYDRSPGSFLGFGQEPERDPRNAFNPATPSTEARFVESQERFIGSVGSRLTEDTELFLSSSLKWRRIDEPRDPQDPAIDEVFVPGSVPGAAGVTRFVYGEVTARVDTRERRAGPVPGALFETYMGYSSGIMGTPGHFTRSGGRVAAFVPIVRSTNILSPKLVIDGLDRLGNEPVAFTELTRQPDFRGFDNRRDALSVVGSLDYSWAIWKYVAARLFVDTATVAPAVDRFTLEGLRYAGGFGFDLFSRSVAIGAIAFIASPEGFRLSLRFGVAPSFGDRQHR